MMSRPSQFERLVFFSDAVFAIAITLLVIEVHLPDRTYANEQDLQQALVRLIPNYAGFLVSFIVIGRFWDAHRRMMAYVRDFTPAMLRANMTLLFAIAFMPFPTAVLNQYGSTRTAIAVYGGWLLFAGIAHLMLARAIRAADGHHVTPLGDGRLLEFRMAWLPILTALAGIAAGMILPLAGLIALTITPQLLRRAIARMAPSALSGGSPGS